MLYHRALCLVEQTLSIFRLANGICQGTFQIFCSGVQSLCVCLKLVELPPQSNPQQRRSPASAANLAARPIGDIKGPTIFAISCIV